MPVEHINPDNLIKSPAFTNVVVVTGSMKTIYVGGQDSVDASGKVVGKGDFKAHFQTAPGYAGNRIQEKFEKHETPLLFNLAQDPSEK